MKKILTILLCVLMLLGLCACSNNADDTTGGEEPVITMGIKTEDETTAPTTPGQETTVADPQQTEENTEKPDATDKKALAESCIGKDVETLYDLIGKPNSSDYAPSCLVEGGEDGMLYYDGFVVYTIKSADGERVDFVEDNNG